MDDTDGDQSHFMTPQLTPRISDANTSELECSFSQREYQQRMAEFTLDLQQHLNHNNESESEAQEQQPTEATDDSNDPNQLNNDPVEIIIDKSLHLQPSEDRDDICSPSQETEPTEEGLSTVVTDIDSVYVSKATTDPSALVNTESLCVPYTDVQDEISIIKQTLTTTTTTLTTECFEPKKNKNDVRHIMISYNHSTKALCSKIAQSLKNLHYDVWIDQENISGDVFSSMAYAVENAFVVLMAVNEQYNNSRYCRLEAEYSVEQNKAWIPMLMESGYKPLGWLGIIKGAKLHIDFSKLPFETAFKSLVREIEAVRISMGVEGDDRTSVTTSFNNTQMTTTMNNSWMNLQNVHEWNTDDVIEWLNREKLEAFQNSLSCFTGATLWQLYKIKFDSAPDYYRTVDSLLLPTDPLRLFHNLSFHAALESLFSQSTQTTHR